MEVFGSLDLDKPRCWLFPVLFMYDKLVRYKECLILVTSHLI